LNEAEKIVAKWGEDGKTYKPSADYQLQLRELMEKYKYRLDTNYAKMDRIVHDEIEAFKSSVLQKELHGMTISAWFSILSKGSDEDIRNALQTNLEL
jgi:hypothetical protein